MNLEGRSIYFRAAGTDLIGYLKFWLKTIFYFFSPSRPLSQFRDPNYIHAQDKHLIRKKHHGKSGWKKQNQGDFQYRDYMDYKEYLTHQKQKFNEILKMKGGFSNRYITSKRLDFYRRFHELSKYLPKSAHILCAGARQGTEVEVLRNLGFSC